MKAQATARAEEIYAAFDGAVERMEKQLRRYKRRLKDHHRDRQDDGQGPRLTPNDSPDSRIYVINTDPNDRPPDGAPNERNWHRLIGTVETPQDSNAIYQEAYAISATSRPDRMVFTTASATRRASGRSPSITTTRAPSTPSPTRST